MQRSARTRDVSTSLLETLRGSATLSNRFQEALDASSWHAGCKAFACRAALQTLRGNEQD